MNWAIGPTPIPDMDEALADTTPVEGAMTSAPPPPIKEGEGQPALAGEAPPPGQPRQATIADVAQAAMDAAGKKAKAAERRINDWLTQCQYHAEQRKALLDCAKLGTLVLKGPAATRRRGRKITIDPQTREAQVSIHVSIDPATTAISPWAFYPDPACGGDLHEGGYCLEQDEIGARKLRDLKDLPGYSAERIDQVIKEGPQRTSLDATGRPKPDGDSLRPDELFDIWYFYGELDKADFELLDADETDLLALFADHMTGPCGDTISVIVTMVNDTPIRIALNPLESGDFPYDSMPWQERAGSIWGFGVPYQIRTPQRMVNAAARNLMDNAGLSGGPILVVDQSQLFSKWQHGWDTCCRLCNHAHAGSIYVQKPKKKLMGENS
jgi:hypothetical protein